VVYSTDLLKTGVGPLNLLFGVWHRLIEAFIPSRVAYFPPLCQRRTIVDDLFYVVDQAVE